MKINLKNAMSMAHAAKELLNENTVDVDRIRARAEICSNCPKRKPAQNFASKVSVVVGFVSGKHGVPSSMGRSACSVCKCALLLLIPSLDENLPVDSPAEAKERPDTCWMKKGI